MGNDRFQLLGTCLDGKFRVEKLVAEGGFGVVYAGQHLSLDRPIAIKVLKTPPELNERAREDFISKFQLEAQTIARLSHLNIVQVIDFGVSAMPSGERAPWMVLEWLIGRSLEQVLQQRRGQGGRAPEQALALLEPIFDALSYAHEEGIAHRDVKPANIMIIPTKRGEMVKLLDFGIVKIMDKGESAEKNLAPTRGVLNAHSPAYAAPEQITGLRTGPWTDVHALALVLTELMTDLPPYEGKNITTLLREILSPQRPTPGRRRIDAGPWESVLEKALALEPADRFKDAAEFLTALKAAMPRQSKPVASTREDTEDLIDTQVLGPVQPAARSPQPPTAVPSSDAVRQSVPSRSMKASPYARSSNPPAAARAAGGRLRSRSTRGVWLAVAGGVLMIVASLVFVKLRKGAGGDDPSASSTAGKAPSRAEATPISKPRGQESRVPAATTETARTPSSATESMRTLTTSAEPVKEPSTKPEITPASSAVTEPKPTPSPIALPLPAVKTDTPPPEKIGARRSLPARKEGSEPARDAETVSRPTAPTATDQPAASKRRPAEPKPLQRTRLPIE